MYHTKRYSWDTWYSHTQKT